MTHVQFKDGFRGGATALAREQALKLAIETLATGDKAHSAIGQPL
jgi:hypothetical protein